MRVTLSYTEVRLAVLLGGDRNLRYIAAGRHRGGGQSPEDGWTDHITGAIAERAVAKALNVYPSSEARPDTDQGDAGRYQVRASARRSGSLIVQTYDPDEACFVLVLGIPPVLDLAGWMTGAEAKRVGVWRTDVRSPAYFVHASALHPMSNLPTL